MRTIHLLAAAKEMADLMYRWNVIDEYDLVIEDSRNGGTPYYHVTTALERILAKLGITGDEKMSFYEMVTSGMSPEEARQRILDNRPEA